MLRLLTDENFNERILRGLSRRLGQMDVVSVREVDLEATPDGFASKVVSFTPGFSPVLDSRHQQKTVSTVFATFAMETVKTVSYQVVPFPTGLKPGVNENDF